MKTFKIRSLYYTSFPRDIPYRETSNGFTDIDVTLTDPRRKWGKNFYKPFTWNILFAVIYQRVMRRRMFLLVPLVQWMEKDLLFCAFFKCSINARLHLLVPSDQNVIDLDIILKISMHLRKQDSRSPNKLHNTEFKETNYDKHPKTCCSNFDTNHSQVRSASFQARTAVLEILWLTYNPQKQFFKCSVS